MSDSFFQPTAGSPKNPVPLLEKRIELLEGEVKMLHGRLESAYRKLAKADGQDPQQAFEKLLEELKQSEAKRLEEEKKALESRSSDGSSSNESKPKDSEPNPKAKGHGPRPQSRLGMLEETYELGNPEKGCQVCGGDLVSLGEQFEEYEEVSVVERRYALKKIKLRKYRCSCNSCVVTAPGPTRFIPGGRYDLDFAVQIAVDKYLDHTPLERQVRIMDRLGLVVTSQTLWDQIQALARIVEAPYQALAQRLLNAPVMHADETRWPLLDGRRASSWTAWARCTPDIAHYEILSSKSAKSARRLFFGYGGIVVADGYQVYERLARDGPGFRVANCWAHARRKFEDIEENFPAACRKALDLIGDLYRIERQIAGPFPGDDQAQRQRHELRQTESKVVLEKIKHWAHTEVGLPRSELGKAVRYMIKRWNGLTLFMENSQVALDNNAAERSLRGPVIGRKVHYGSKSKRGTEVAAIFYSLLETAKLCGVEPAAYLKAAAQAALEEPGKVLLPHDLAK